MRFINVYTRIYPCHVASCAAGTQTKKNWSVAILGGLIGPTENKSLKYDPPPRLKTIQRIQGLNQSARIFFIRVFSGYGYAMTRPKKGETAVYGYNPALF